MCHFYVGDMTRPKVTFGLYEGSSGQVGFNPRIVGWPVWIDNVEVTSIESLSFRGPSRPEVAYEPGALLTDWQVIGPLTSPVVEIERASDPGGEVITVGSETQVWRDFDTDARGAVITGRVTEHDGPRPVAYFRTVLAADQAGPVELRVSTVDELALWVNGEYHGFIYRNGYMFGRRDWNAWWDFWKNPEHEGRSTSIDLAAGVNQLVFRVRNGQFASGGFFARID